ncbi:sialidase family protein [Bradyrhizobium septentrionale]|uniref:Exo-alpha-sialidase n=1 Tax=Bradyrhizobium septentrionale TaxID=1404411 RepID=A0A973W231_9BRAD|nr:sialidase family protein [Bradyrhizobium septentrionale]UGY14768.1 glycoside hydrolase [Bradyrhizobium septentrionale]UGY23342.1 glycoside hydrolase [Bradyrhizobium septentrionale]
MTNRKPAALTVLATIMLAVLPNLANAQMSHQHASEAACEETVLRCATKVTPVFGPDGTLWLAWMAGGQISVASSRDQGKSFSAPLQVTPERLNLDWGPDARPKLAVDAKGNIALAFSTFRDQAFNGQVLTTRSSDGGRSFDPPKPITKNNESQRFEAIGFDPAGAVFAVWLDKRNRVPAQQRGEKYDGAGLFFAASTDGGATYSDARLAADNTCECCRLGLAFDGAGHPVVVFRNIFEGGVRDHAIVTFTDLASPGEVHRVSRDDWQIAACPHHGPSLTISPAGTYHVTWYTNGKARKGLFYAQSRDGGKTFSDPLPVGQPNRSPSRPQIIAGPQGLVMAWKEFDGQKTSINLMTSHDDGATWSKPTDVAETADSSDHPLLVSDGRQTYLSWMTKADGYHFQAIEGEP